MRGKTTKILRKIAKQYAAEIGQPQHWRYLYLRMKNDYKKVRASRSDHGVIQITPPSSS